MYDLVYSINRWARDVVCLVLLALLYAIGNHRGRCLVQVSCTFWHKHSLQRQLVQADVERCTYGLPPVRVLLRRPGLVWGLVSNF